MYKRQLFSLYVYRCWMQIQVGKGPHASEVSGIVKIGQTMTMVLGVKDDENKFDMMVCNWRIKTVLNSSEMKPFFACFYPRSVIAWLMTVSVLRSSWWTRKAVSPGQRSCRPSRRSRTSTPRPTSSHTPTSRYGKMSI